MHKSGTPCQGGKGTAGVAADSYYLRRFYCEYRKINCRCNRARSLCPALEAAMNFAYLTTLESNLFASTSFIYNLSSGIDGDLAIDKRDRGGTCSRYRYSDTFPIPVNGSRNQWRRYEIIRVDCHCEGPEEERDKYRGRIIGTITFTYRYKLYPAPVGASFTTHCYFPGSARPRRPASLISLVKEPARQVVEAKFSTINFIGVLVHGVLFHPV